MQAVAARSARLTAAAVVARACLAMGQVVHQGEPPPEPVTPDEAPVRIDQASRPRASGRVVRLFDFEEQTTNPGLVPRYWFRAQDDPTGSGARSGFPPWNLAELVYGGEHGAVSGEGVVILPTRGGSVSLRLASGVIPIFAEADYAVTAQVRTDDLKHSGAALVVRFLDAKGDAIAGAERRSEIIRTGGEWRPISVQLRGLREGPDAGQAAYLQVELLVLQPREAATSRSRPHTVWQQDYAGSAAFDDVAIVQLPRVELRTDSPRNITEGDQPPEVRVTLRDLTGEALSVNLRAVDSRGNVADSVVRRLGAGQSVTRWRPALPARGWYRIEMDVTAGRTRVGGSELDLLWMTPGPSRRHAMEETSPFGLVVRSAEPREQIPPLAHLLQVGAITLPMWEAGKEDAPDPAAWKRCVNALLADGTEVSFSLGRIPGAMVSETGVPTHDVWGLLTGERARWAGALDPVLDAFGQRIRRWQIGDVGDDEAFWRADLAADTKVIRDAFGRLVSGPELVLPTRAERAWEGRDLTGASLSIVAGPELTPSAVGEILSRLPRFERGGRVIDVVLPTPEAARYGMHAPAAELVKRMVEVWAAGHGRRDWRMVIEQPWTISSEGQAAVLNPTPSLGAWVTSVRALAGRRVAGDFPVADGVVCRILAPAESGRGGALVAWNQSASPGEAVIEASIGDGVIRVVDMYGNSYPAVRVGDGPNAPVRIPLTTDPVFIEGIDTQLAEFIAGVMLDNPLLESTSEQHERTVLLRNPWPTNITGRVTILEPGGVDAASGLRDRSWRISPRTLPFNVPPRSELRLPFRIAFSPSEEAGEKPFVVAVDLTAERAYGEVVVQRTLTVGTGEVRMDVTAIPRGEDLVIEAAISTSASRPVTLDLTAFAPGSPRAKAVVSELKPGESTVRRFVLYGKLAELKGKRVLVSARDAETGAILSRGVQVE